MLYFGYGSNMSRARIEKRLGPCERLGAAYLTGYVLQFHKRSLKDRSGKCNAFRTGDPRDRLWGALDRLTDDQFEKLDGIEGSGYSRVPVDATFGERTVRAHLYLARPDTLSPGLRPLELYKRYVVEGARELELPADYIAAIEALPTTSDPN